MRRYTIYNRLTAIAAGLCLCFLLAACGEDRGGDLPDDDPNSCVVTITLRTSRSARPPRTKAGGMMTKAGSWEEEEEAYERDITDWLVVAYDVEGGLAGYQSREGVWTPNIPGKEEDSYTSVEMRLPVGTYNFYAFANLQSLEDGVELYNSITDETSSIDNLEREVKILASGASIDGRNEVSGKFGGADEEGTGNRLRIPMSSYAQVHTLSPTGENKFDIPLIRMIGKVQVKITNNLTQPIIVNQLDIMNLRKGSLPIWLLPWGEFKYLETAGNEGVETRGPDLPTGKEVAEGHLFNEEIVLAGDETIPAKTYGGEEGPNIKTYTRYIPEGNAGAKEILLGVDIEGRPHTEHTTNFGFVRRNDLLVIPVLINNIETRLEVAEQRLPIGVYPTALVYGEKTGVQILTPVEHTLQASGDLSIRFEITTIEGVTGDFTIKGLPQDGVVPETAKFSSIQVESDEKHLITAVNGTESNGKQRFYLPAASIEEGHKGSFTIRTQELGGNAEATIVLTLVINYGENMEQEMQIPYTINIRNYENKQQP